MKEKGDEENIIENSKSTLLLEGSNISKIVQEKNEDTVSEQSSAAKNLIYEVKPISLFKLICHLSGKLDIFFMIIGTISTIFTGCSYSLWGLLFGDTINDLSNIIDIEDLPDDEYNKELDKIEVEINQMIYYFIYLGILTFVCNFFMLFMWGYSALRQMHKMKKNYFSIILSQDQSWFDENNAFELSTKVQTQLEQIEFGMGDKFGQIILMFCEILSGFAVGFLTSWKLTLVIFTSFPIIIFGLVISDCCAENLLIKSRKEYEKANSKSLFSSKKILKPLHPFVILIMKYLDMVN